MPHLNRILIAVLGLAAIAAAECRAQAVPQPQRHILVAEDYEAGTRVLPSVFAGKNASQSAVFDVTYEDFPQAARLAFDYALSIWGTHIASSVPIRVRARWTDLGTNVLGSAGPASIFSLVDAPYSNTWYPAALAAAIAGTPLVNDDEYHIVASLSSEVTWYFGVDAAPPTGTFDFVTVILHEIGHGIGMFGSFRVQDGEEDSTCNGAAEGEGCWGFTAFPQRTLPMVFDRFVTDASAGHLIDTGLYPNPSISLTGAFESAGLYFDGITAMAAHHDLPIELYAPASFSRASSIAHLDEATFPAGDPNSLMTPGLARSEAIHTPGPLFCGILDDMGWPLGDACIYLLEHPYVGIDDGEDDDSDPVTAELPLDGFENLIRIEALFPNPAMTDVTTLLVSGIAQSVTVSLVDMMGRQVRGTDTMMMLAGQSRSLEMSVDGLSPGVYLLRVTGEHGSASRPVVVAR